MFSIFDGRTAFYQWDLDRKLIVNDPSISKVHFCNRTGSCSLVRCVYEVNGVYLVDVPNIILQESYRVNVYGYDANYTKHSESFNIVPRTKPEDYVYTDNEVATWEALEERITQIEENGISDETVAAAIDKYLEENPIEAGATEEEAAQIAANTTAIEELERKSANYATTTYVGKTIDFVLGEYATKDFVRGEIDKAQIGGEGEVDLSNYYTKEETQDIIGRLEIPKDTVNEVEVKSIVEGYNYTTLAAVEAKGYLTQHQDLSNYYTKAQTDAAINAAKPDLSTYATQKYVDDAVATIGGGSAFVVNFYSTGYSTYEADKTLNEVLEAAESGCVVVGVEESDVIGMRLYQLIQIGNGNAYFSYQEAERYNIIEYAESGITSDSGFMLTLDDIEEPLIVFKVDEDANGYMTYNKSYANLASDFDTYGKAVLCVYNSKKTDKHLMLSLIEFSVDDGFVFTGLQGNQYYKLTYDKLHNITLTENELSTDLTGYAKTSDIPDVSQFQTASQVQTAINTAIAAIIDGEEVSY